MPIRDDQECAATGEGHRFGPRGMNKEHQCEFCGIELRECCNPDCGWRGATTRMLGSIGPLCPVCDEVTEAVKSDAICGSYPTCIRLDVIGQAAPTYTPGKECPCVLKEKS